MRNDQDPLSSPSAATDDEASRPRLSESVHRDHLLAEIVQGLLTAHARLDLMEKCLKAATEAAVDQQLRPGVEALKSIRAELDGHLSVLKEGLDKLSGLEQRLRSATQAATQRLETVLCEVQKWQESRLDALEQCLSGLGHAESEAIRRHVTQQGLEAIGQQRALIDQMKTSLAEAIAAEAKQLLAAIGQQRALIDQMEDVS